MKFDMKVRAKKDGFMNDGAPFCYKGFFYEATVLPGTEEEGGDYYFVMDENNNDPLAEPHGMDKEFFDEHFEVPFEDLLYNFLNKNSEDFRKLSMDRQGEIITDCVNKLGDR
jgi:hypothetical protein